MTTNSPTERDLLKYKNARHWVNDLYRRMDTAGITQGMLVKETGFNDQEFARWHNRGVNPSFDKVLHIERAFHRLLKKQSK